MSEDPAGERMRAPRVLVTGANGFVGRSVCTHMRAAGWHVRGSVRGGDRVVEPGVETVLLPELADGESLRQAVGGSDVVVHLAAMVHQLGDEGPDALDRYRQVNVEGSRALARASARAGVRRFVYVSSVKVHGESTRGTPFRESEAPAPEDPYGISKMEAERAVVEVGRESGMQTVVVRPPLVYGPGVRANFLALLRLIDRALPLPLGSIHNRRSLVFVQNLARFLVECASHPRAANETFLIADDRPLSTTELVRLIARALESRSILLPVPPAMLRGAARMVGRGQMADRLTHDLVVDASRAAERLDWRPPFTVEQGIEETVRWFRARPT